MLNESTKDEMLDLHDRLEGLIYGLHTLLEDSEEVSNELWVVIDRMIEEIIMTQSKIKTLVNYS